MSAARIAVGAVVGTIGGPATYGRELVAALAKRANPEFDLVVITDRPKLFSSFGVQVMHAPLPSPYLQVVWDHVAVRLALTRVRADLYHGTKQVLPLLDFRSHVVTIHDLAVYQHPRTFSRLQRWHLRTHMPHALRRAERIIAVSQQTAHDIADRFPQAVDRLSVVLNGVSPRFRPIADASYLSAFRSRYRLGQGPVILYLGTLQPRKGIGSVIEAFSRLTGKYPEATLVIAGRVRPGYEPGLPAAERVRLLGVVPDEDLPALYATSSVMVSPSLYEGFGLTVIEAMACGCPVVALKRSALPEVAGDAALLLESSASDVLAGAIDRLLGQRALWLEMRKRGLARARRFSWGRAAELTEAVYRAALAERSR